MRKTNGPKGTALALLRPAATSTDSATTARYPRVNVLSDAEELLAQRDRKKTLAIVRSQSPLTITPERMNAACEAALSKFAALMNLETRAGGRPRVLPDNPTFALELCRELTKDGGVTVHGVPITIDGASYAVCLTFVCDGHVCLAHVVNFGYRNGDPVN